MSIIHKELAAGRWFQLSLLEQLANIGSDVIRAIRWKQKGDSQYSQDAFDRAVELMDLTKADPKNRGRLKEVGRMREFFTDYFVGENIYGFTDDFWQRYFDDLSYAAAIARGR